MINYLKAEIIRQFKKKSIYFLLGLGIVSIVAMALVYNFTQAHTSPVGYLLAMKDIVYGMPFFIALFISSGPIKNSMERKNIISRGFGRLGEVLGDAISATIITIIAWIILVAIGLIIAYIFNIGFDEAKYISQIKDPDTKAILANGAALTVKTVLDYVKSMLMPLYATVLMNFGVLFLYRVLNNGAAAMIASVVVLNIIPQFAILGMGAKNPVVAVFGYIAKLSPYVHLNMPEVFHKFVIPTVVLFALVLNIGSYLIAKKRVY